MEGNWGKDRGKESANRQNVIRSILEEQERAAFRKIYNSYYNEYIRQKVAALMAGADNFAKISPFNDAWLASGWKRISDLSLLPVASAGAEQQIGKYGHFIFGHDEKFFYLGVPGRHNAEEWPDAGKSGFMMWQSIRGSDEYGYWAMVIDWKTGIITEIS